MIDVAARAARRAHESMPTRSTAEALDAALRRVGDGPWLPEPALLGETTWDVFVAWAPTPIVLERCEDGIYRRVEVEPHPDEVRHTEIVGWTIDAPLSPLSLAYMRSVEATGEIRLTVGDRETFHTIASHRANQWHALPGIRDLGLA